MTENRFGIHFDNILAIGKPSISEYPTIRDTYVSKVDYDNLIFGLVDFHEKTQTFLASLEESAAEYRYDIGKWSIKELLGHLIDTERIFSYRALRFARNDKTNLPGYDEDFFTENAHSHQRVLADLLAEFLLVRKSTIALFQSFTAEMLDRKGFADNNEMTVRAIGYIILGHEVHHLKIINERYIK